MDEARTRAGATDPRAPSEPARGPADPATAIGVLRHGRPEPLVPQAATALSRGARWDGLALQALTDLPAVAVLEHEHPTHTLSLLVGAPLAIEWTTGGRTRWAVTEPGTIHLLPKGTSDRLVWKGRSSRVIVTLEPRLLTSALERTAHLDDLDLETHWQLDDRHLSSLILALQADMEDGCPAGRLFGESLGTAIAVSLARRYGHVRSEPLARGGLPGYRLRRVCDYIASNLDQPLGLSELAALSGASPHYFGELFRRSTGLSPHRYVLMRRIERAKALLRNQGLNVLDVAVQTGFADQSHFTKVFRRIAGMTPSQYRAGR